MPFTLTGLSDAKWGGLPWVKGIIHTIPSPQTARTDASRLMVAVQGHSEVVWRQGRKSCRRLIEPGSITFMDSDVELEHVQSIGDYESFGIEFDPARIDRWTGRGSVREALKLSHLPRHFAAHDPHVLILARAMEQEGVRRLGLLYAQSVCLTLLSYVWGKYARSHVPVLSGGLSRVKVNELKDFIWEHLGSNLSLEDLAEQAGLSASHFCSSFKRAAGISPHQYLLRARIERSKELLRSTPRSITDVALVTGFSSASHFAAAFKKATALTPVQYQKLN